MTKTVTCMCPGCTEKISKLLVFCWNCEMRQCKHPPKKTS